MINKNVVVIKQQMVNEWGSGYGTRYLLFAERPADAEAWIAANLDGPEGEPYYNGRGLYDQIVVETVTYYDRDGNASRDPWWMLLEAFAKKDVGMAQMKAIARMSQWWPPTD